MDLGDLVVPQRVVEASFPVEAPAAAGPHAARAPRALRRRRAAHPGRREHGAVGRRVVAQGLVRAQVEHVVAIGQRHGALRGVRRQDDLEAAVRRRREGPGLVLVGQLAVHGHALEAPELGRGPRDVADVRAAARLQAVREVADVRHARHEDERAGLGRVARESAADGDDQFVLELAEFRVRRVLERVVRGRPRGALGLELLPRGLLPLFLHFVALALPGLELFRALDLGVREAHGLQSGGLRAAAEAVADDARHGARRDVVGEDDVHGEALRADEDRRRALEIVAVEAAR